MTLVNPSLFLNRLIVTTKGKTAYDEAFHKGVNIIRGSADNSVGKSTIMDFIFFVLGGDLTSLTPEAASCNSVFAEVEINGAKVTLKREVSTSSGQGMWIFWGEIGLALKSVVEGWQVYPFRRREPAESFSQVLFRALDFPEVKGDATSNITMHQLLRLIYVDQNASAIDSLMRDERFDSALTRRTVGELLFGVYDDTIYQEEILLREKKKRLEDSERQLDTVVAVLNEAEQEVDPKKLHQEISQTQEQLDKIQKTLNEGASAELVSQYSHANTLEIASQNLTKLRRLEADQTNELERQCFEVEDSKMFLESLGHRLVALNDSVVAKQSLGTLPLTHCPSCLSELPAEAPEGYCKLCKQKSHFDAEKSQALRMRQELALQIKESRELLVDKEKHLQFLKISIPQISEKARAQQRIVDGLLSTIKKDRDQFFDDLFTKKGNLEARLQDLTRQLKAVGVVDNLRLWVSRLTAEVKNLEFSIIQKRKTQTARWSDAIAKINYYAVYLLKNDLPVEERFRNAINVSINFDQNTFAVDGANKFSASSNAYLKASVHFATFFSSLVLPFFRYPRLIICDNMEDKGMRVERSQQFQRLIVDASKSFTTEHQIIFSTSMIAPELNNSELCVGPDYNKDRKSLRM